MEIAESIEATRQSVIRMFQVLERAALLLSLIHISEPTRH